MLLIALAYLAVNVAYFAVVSKQDMLGGGTVAAYGSFIIQLHIRTKGVSRALFFRNIFGPATERVSDIHGLGVAVVSHLISRS